MPQPTADKLEPSKVTVRWGLERERAFLRYIMDHPDIRQQIFSSSGDKKFKSRAHSEALFNLTISFFQYDTLYIQDLTVRGLIEEDGKGGWRKSDRWNRHSYDQGVQTYRQLKIMKQRYRAAIKAGMLEEWKTWDEVKEADEEVHDSAYKLCPLFFCIQHAYWLSSPKPSRPHPKHSISISPPPSAMKYRQESPSSSESDTSDSSYSEGESSSPPPIVERRSARKRLAESETTYLEIVHPAKKRQLPSFRKRVRPSSPPKSPSITPSLTRSSRSSLESSIRPVTPATPSDHGVLPLPTLTDIKSEDFAVARVAPQSVVQARDPRLASRSLTIGAAAGSSISSAPSHSAAVQTSSAPQLGKTPNIQPIDWSNPTYGNAFLEALYTNPRIRSALLPSLHPLAPGLPKRDPRKIRRDLYIRLMSLQPGQAWLRGVEGIWTGLPKGVSGGWRAGDKWPLDGIDYGFEDRLAVLASSWSRGESKQQHGREFSLRQGSTTTSEIMTFLFSPSASLSAGLYSKGR